MLANFNGSLASDKSKTQLMVSILTGPANAQRGLTLACIFPKLANSSKRQDTGSENILQVKLIQMTTK